MLRFNAIVMALLSQSVSAPLWTPNANVGVADWQDSTTLTDGTITTWPSVDPYLQTFTFAGTGTLTKDSTGVIFTGTQYLTKPAKAPYKLRTRTTWPDSIVGSNDPGIGPTCTGICGTNVPNVYWSGFHGYTRTSGVGSPGITPSTARLVKFQFDPVTGSITVLQTIDVMALYGVTGQTSTYSVQGVSFDRRTGYVWFGFIGFNNAMCVDPNTGANGTRMTALEITAAFTVTAVAVDPVSNRIWCLEQAASGNLTYRLAAYDMTSKSEVVAPFNTNLGSQDSMFFREADNTLYVSYGDNGEAGSVRVYWVGSTTPKRIGDVTLPTYIDAIEGVAYDETTGKMLVNNDAGYHIAGGEKNELFQFDLPPLTSTKAEMLVVVQMTAVAAAKGIYFIGEPLGGASMGFGMSAPNATSIQVFANTGVSGTTQRSLYTFTVPSLVTAARIILAQWDTVAQTCRLWCDGVEITGPTVGAAMSVLVGPLSGMSSSILANSADNLTRQMTGTLKQVHAAIGTFSDVDKINGWAAWKTNLTANLASNHPYKNAAPTV